MSRSLADSNLNRPERFKQLKKELEEARAVQSAFLPKSRSLTNLEVAVTYTPALEIAGDFCDAFDADHGRAAVVIGDVSGKGIAPGLLSGIIYGAVHSSSWTESSFHHEEATERLNDLLRRKTSVERFASLFWGYYEPETSTFRYISAGHLPMLLIRRTETGTQIERLEHGGPVLGILEWGNYKQGSIRVREGDLLILFSDGVVEAMNGAEDLFGEWRLFSVIRDCAADSPAEIQDAILRAVHAHVGDSPKADDRTLMIARFHDVFAEIAPTRAQQLAV